MKARRTVALFSVASIALLAACGSDDDTAGDTETTDAGSETTEPAAGGDVCPQKLTIQTDWFPELEHGGTYQLIGPTERPTRIRSRTPAPSRSSTRSEACRNSRSTPSSSTS
jgi:hypothetical protein